MRRPRFERGDIAWEVLDWASEPWEVYKVEYVGRNPEPRPLSTRVIRLAAVIGSRELGNVDVVSHNLWSAHGVVELVFNAKGMKPWP